MNEVLAEADRLEMEGNPLGRLLRFNRTTIERRQMERWGEGYCGNGDGYVPGHGCGSWGCEGGGWGDGYGCGDGDGNGDGWGLIV